MCGITFVAMFVILVVAVGVQVLGAQHSAHQSAVSMLTQLDRLLEDNTKELESIKEEYAKLYLIRGESLEDFEKLYQETISAYELRKNTISSLYTEIKNIKKLRV